MMIAVITVNGSTRLQRRGECRNQAIIIDDV